MKKLLLYLFLLIAGMYLGNSLTLKYFPNLIFAAAKKKIDSGENIFRYAGLPNENSRHVVKPNPDFLYATCFYDLSTGPLRLTGELPWFTYWSLALYEPNTNNYFIKNDREFDNNEIEIILSKNKIEGIEKGKNIISPSNKGLIIFRILVTEKVPEKLEKYTEFQRSIKIEAYKADQAIL